jgi:CheY-like chemotaxis protein
MPRTKVLLVDDDGDLRATCADLLEDAGYDVVQADSGEQAIARAETFSPDVVITDLNMAGMTGLEVCAHFALGKKPTPPVIVISGMASAEVDVKQRGAAGFVAKPFTLEELSLAVRGVLDGGMAPAQQRAFAAQKAQTRAATRAMAEAAIHAGLANDHEMQARNAHVARWLSSFYAPAVASTIFPARGKLSVYTASDHEREEGHDAPPSIERIADTVIATASSLIVPDVEAQPWLGVPSGEWRSIVAAPFRYFDVPVGMLCVVTSTPRAFGASDVAILEHITARAMERLALHRAPVLGSRSWLLARETFRKVLEIEATAVSGKDECIAIALFRTPVDRRLTPLLDELPARRMHFGELRDDVVAAAVRGECSAVHSALSAAGARVRALGDVAAYAELVVGAPFPDGLIPGLLTWAESLLEATDRSRSVVVVDAQAKWSAIDAGVKGQN